MHPDCHACKLFNAVRLINTPTATVVPACSQGTALIPVLLTNRGYAMEPLSSASAPLGGVVGGEPNPVPPKQTVDTGHGDTVHDAQLDFYGRRLATCSSDRSIRIFDVDGSGNRVLQATLEGHDGPVWQISWAHPTRHVASVL
jgi:WD40 repeat protein